jgi:hypothetical protein
LKKIFSILLSLAMLVSLAALTTTPVSAADECVCPTLSPASGTYDLTDPSGVATNIIWGDATNVTDVKFCNGTSLASSDWIRFGSLLGISSDFLATVLTDCDECVCLEVVFDVCVVNFIITATGEDATLTPKSTTWVLNSGDDVDVTITWADEGNDVKNVTYTHPYNTDDVEELAAGTDYNAVDNGDGTGNLTILDNWLKTELLTIGSSVKLDVEFDMCAAATLTISCVAAPLPTVMPQVITYCIGCPQNISTEIVWGNATPPIVSVRDITSPQLAATLVLNTDYYLDADNDTLIIEGGVTGSAWHGLACRLDACNRLARLLAINFNDACNTTVILTINAACTTAPSITPTDIIVDLDAWACDPLMLLTSKSGALLSLGTASGIANVTDITPNDCCTGLKYPPSGKVLVTPTQWYMAYAPAYGGNLLAISRPYYLQYAGVAMAAANLTQCGDQVKLLIQWTPTLRSTTVCGAQIASYLGFMYCPTTITVTATSALPTICPTKADYNLDAANDPVKTEITWSNLVGNITEIRASKCSIPTLVRDVDYSLSPDGGDCNTPSVLTINDSYLNQVLKKIGDQAVLTLVFGKCGSTTFTITAVGTPMCFIATAAGADAPQLDVLRAFRDNVMRPNALGAKLVSLYYAVSPPIAEFISQHDVLRAIVRVGLVDPLAALLGAL